MNDDRDQHEEVILLGAGCFWGVEDQLRQLAGVVATRVGFAGGTVPAPTYELVCTGTTGHAEVVEVRYRGSHATLEEILRYFWAHHSASGPNVGQYRSVVVCTSPEQLAIVRAIRAEATTDRAEGDEIATEIVVGAPFYEAEEEHQQYYEKGRQLVREVRRQCGLD